MDYKNTLNMPQTDFEMKGNLPTKEPLYQKEWVQKNIEQQIYSKNKNLPKFTLHDGPPYANGNIHVGHALNKIIKDFIVRSKNMNGYLSKFIAGWDTHGMPIEVALLKTGKNKDPNLSIVEKRQNCRAFALDWISKQKEQFARLGLMTNFNEIYQTLDHGFEINQLRLFNKLVADGLVYQDLKPIYWSWSSRTALADAEVEYADVESNSIYVKFPVVSSNILEPNDNLIIWTTTPWTIPSNLAVAVHPDYEYVKIKSGNEGFILIKENYEKVCAELNLPVDQIIKTIKGSELENTLYKHPLYEKENPVILATYVSNQDGTGIVHNAPGFGHDDYLACKRYNINVFCPINEFGKFTDEINDEELVGLFYEDTNDLVIQRLENKNLLLKKSKITNSVAHDWRTKKPVMYRATKQWFVNLSKITTNIVNSLKDVSSIQGNSIVEKIKTMVKNRQEWCISRQRYWGVPIIIIYDENNEAIFDNELQKNILNILDKEGTEVWFEKPAEYFLTEKYSGRTGFHKEQDIMDVWFDSGSSHLILKDRDDVNYPADLYFEGKDQFRGWFNSSLICSVAYNNFCPYKTLLTHGFTLDEKGRKMSKSLGNVISPMEIYDQYGADVLRMTIALSEYSDDIRISFDIVKQTSEIYRRLRNSLFKFILGNLHDYNYKANKTTAFTDMDKYVLFSLNNLKKTIIDSYEKYDFKVILKEINNFTLDLSSFYFEYIKDSLYCYETNNVRRRTIQTVLYYILETILILITPIIPHTAYECYNHFNKANKKDNVFLESFKTLHNFDKIEINEQEWKTFFELKDKIFAGIENARKDKVINKTNEAFIQITTNESLPTLAQYIPKLLNVAGVAFTNGNELKITVTNSNFLKCERCWNYFKTLKDNENKICDRCVEVLKKI